MKTSQIFSKLYPLRVLPGLKIDFIEKSKVSIEILTNVLLNQLIFNRLQNSLLVHFC
jgi:hypothetical protein